MRRGWGIAVVVALLLALPPSASGWAETHLRESPAGAVATCLRAAGAGTVGLLGPLRGMTAHYDLLRLTAAGTQRTARLALPVIAECPSVASNGIRTVLAGMTYRTGLVAWVHEGGSTRRVGLSRREGVDAAAAVAIDADGGAVFAWTESRRRFYGAVTATRVVLRRMSREGRFGRTRQVTPWQRAGGQGVGRAEVTAAMDGAGNATIAWTQPRPDRGPRLNQGGGRTITDLADIGVGQLRADGDWSRQRLGRDIQDVGPPALAVAPDGKAVLAHAGHRAIRVFDRGRATGRFVRRASLGSNLFGATKPAVAIQPGGGAAVGWFEAEYFAGFPAVRVSTRRQSGSFGPARPVRARRKVGGTNGGSFISLASDDEQAFAPVDSDNLRLAATLDARNRWVLAWGESRPSGFGDAPTAAYAAAGRLGGRAGRARRLGCGCRAVNGVTPLLLASGDSGVAFTDNRTEPLTFGPRGVTVDELAIGGGRLHLADPSEPWPPVTPLDQVAVAARAQRLRYEDPIRVTVACGRPCDVRAVVAGKSRPFRDFPPERGVRAIGTATLRERGNTVVELRPGWAGRLAPIPPARVKVVVRAWPLGGLGRARVITVRPRLSLIRPPRPPRPRDVVATRRGRRVTVTWSMRRPARRVDFAVTLEPASRNSIRRGRFFRHVEGEGRRRFRAAFRLRAGERPRSARVFAEVHWPPYRTREVKVPIEPQG